MSKPFLHSKSSVRKFKGKESDYIEIHNLFDSSKEWFPDNRHRVIFHHSAGIFLMEKLFGIHFDGIEKLRLKYDLPISFDDDVIQLLKDNRMYGTCIKNSDGRLVSVRDIGEQHVLEDYKMKFIPTPADFISEMDFVDWMQNAEGLPPASHKKIAEKHKKEDVSTKVIEYVQTEFDFMGSVDVVVDVVVENPEVNVCKKMPNGRYIQMEIPFPVIGYKGEEKTPSIFLGRDRHTFDGMGQSMTLD